MESTHRLAQEKTHSYTQYIVYGYSVLTQGYVARFITYPENSHPENDEPCQTQIGQ